MKTPSIKKPTVIFKPNEIACAVNKEQNKQDYVPQKHVIKANYLKI